MKFLSRAFGKGHHNHFLVLATILLLAMPVASWGSDLAKLLSGGLCPLSAKLMDLGTEWRRVTIHGGGGANGNVEMNVNGSSQGQTQQNNVLGTWEGGQSYLTKGQTISADGQTYLVAYRLPGTALDFSALLQAMATKTLPQAEILKPESSLRLSLLNVRSIGTIEDIREFDMKWEIAQSQEAAQKIMNLLKTSETATPAKTPEKK